MTIPNDIPMIGSQCTLSYATNPGERHHALKDRCGGTGSEIDIYNKVTGVSLVEYILWKGSEETDVGDINILSFGRVLYKRCKTSEGFGQFIPSAHGSHSALELWESDTSHRAHL